MATIPLAHWMRCGAAVEAKRHNLDVADLLVFGGNVPCQRLPSKRLGRETSVGLRYILKGLATHAPGASLVTQMRTGGSTESSYCYAVWLRHLVMAHRSKLCTTVPARVAELGPGDTLGVGLAALLSGAERYIGLDVKRFAAEKNNTNILIELAALMQERADIPAPDVLPHVKPYLGDYAFPADVVTPAVLAQTLSPHSMQVLHDALVYLEGGPIRYVVPWTSDSIEPASLDMIIAQAVMEYVSDIDVVYKTLARWLAPGGFVSLQVDLKCHGCAQEWNGHYAYSDRAWELIKGRRKFYLNREPLSRHIAAIEGAGLEVVTLQRLTRRSTLLPSDLAPAFRNMSMHDLTTTGAFVQARLSA